MNGWLIAAVVVLVIVAYSKASPQIQDKIKGDAQSFGNTVCDKIQGEELGKINCASTEQCVSQYDNSSCDLNTGNCIRGN